MRTQNLRDRGGVRPPPTSKQPATGKRGGRAKKMAQPVAPPVEPALDGAVNPDFAMQPGAVAPDAPLFPVPRWDPIPRLAAVIQAVDTATALPDLMSCLIELDRLNDPDPTRAPYPLEEDNDWTDRWVLAEAKVLERIAGLRPETADQAQTLFKLMAARIEDDVIERANVNQYIWSALMTAHECLWSPATAAAADTDLIRTCHLHPAYIKAYNLHGGDLELEKDPLWKAYEQSRDAISDFEPKSISGMLAKAHAAKAEAANKDGTENPDGTMAATWSWDLVNDLLRLFGTPEVVAAPQSHETTAPGLSITTMAHRMRELSVQYNRHDGLATEAEPNSGKRRTHDAARNRVYAQEEALEALIRATPATTVTEAVLRLRCIGSEINNLTGFKLTPAVEEELSEAVDQLCAALAGLSRLTGVKDDDLGTRALSFGAHAMNHPAEGEIL
ncbi:hypothetical protein RGI145_12430 [Roseomonas gilardii]|uniref:Uncharacterized protein n=1 Tax=Roseomonas gilardii TaxID=257708 RepID=A0A1L7AGH6_9PROT|nr:hypothetical protein [Roseomonas gilardii]APT57799.1 hypothetical protein RGI145_12430 [Roseomonas gilardii]